MPGVSTMPAPGYVRAACIAIVVFLFALTCIAGRYTTYAIFLLTLAVLLTPSIRTAFVLRSRNPIDLMLVVAAILPGIAFLFTSEEPQDLLFAFNFAPLVLAIPFRWQLERLGRTDGAAWIGWLSLAGVTIALGVAMVQVVILGRARAGQPLMSPFQFADSAVLLGFMALAGLFVPGGRWKPLLLAGPLIGVAAAVVGGTRGAMIAVPVLIVVALAFAYYTARNRRLLMLTLAGTLIATIAIVLVALQLGFGRALDGFVATAQALTGGEVDEPTRERLVMYWGGLQAYFAAPLFGHGWLDMVPAILPHVDPSDVERMTTFRHLHNGLLSFAVGAGLPGIVSFVILSIAPVLAVLATPRDGQFVARLYMAATLCAGYAMFQLTIIMIGFEFHTVQYAFIAMAIVAFAATPPAATRARSEADGTSSAT